MNSEVELKEEKGGITLPPMPESRNLIFCGDETPMYNLELLMRASMEWLGWGTIVATYKAMMGNHLILLSKACSAQATQLPQDQLGLLNVGKPSSAMITAQQSLLCTGCSASSSPARLRQLLSKACSAQTTQLPQAQLGDYFSGTPHLKSYLASTSPARRQLLSIDYHH
ncbi:hypothetical protein U1Q18_028159 [Sarracenia purpurea var. burkii]